MRKYSKIKTITSEPPVHGGDDEYIERAKCLGKDVARFLWAQRTRGISLKTIRTNYFDLLYFYRWLGSTNLAFEKIEEAQLLRFIHAQQKHSVVAESINRRLSVIHQLYRFCFGKNIPASTNVVTPNPYFEGPGRDHALGIWRKKRKGRLQLRVKEPSRIVEPLKVDEARAFIQSLGRYRDVAITLLMLLCGLRSMEVLGLRIEDVDLAARQMRIRGKGNKERILPIPDAVERAFEKYFRFERGHPNTEQVFVVLKGKSKAQPMTTTGLNRLFQYRRESTGIHKANAHRFRHTFGAQMARAGVKFPVLQRLMGHSSGKTTLKYIYLSMSDVADEYREAMEKIHKRYEEFSRELT